MDEKKDIVNIVFIGFADNRVPEFKEVPSKDWILFGENNIFPDHLLYLYNKSSVHGAIINNKVKYIIGKGINPEGQLLKINRDGESINKVLEKSCKDIETFGGFYWQIIYNALGKITEIVHTPFQTIRKAKSGKGYFHCKRWDWNKHKKQDPKFIPNFDINNPVGVQLFAFKEYRPGGDEYPLPGYFSGLNDIETDTEISIYNLSVMKNGQFSGKLISFFDGVPTQEEQKKLEKKWNDKFNGSGNAGKNMLAFNRDTAKPPQVDDMSTTDLDKLFDQLSKTTQQKIFAAHEVTSPILFGIMQVGSLGNRAEFQDAYEIFKNTYANSKQQAIEEVLAFFLPLLGLQAQKLIPVDMIAPAVGVVPSEGMSTNENVKNLTGRQYQQVMRIVRQFDKKQITKERATLLLRTSLGMSDEEIEVLLTAEEKFAQIYTESEVAEMFSECGEGKESFSIVKSRPYQFGENGHDEFVDVKGLDSSIIDLIRKDKRVTAEVIAKTLRIEPSYVTSRIKTLEQRGVLQTNRGTVGIDTIIEHSVNTEVIDKIDRPETVDIFIKYSYEPKTGLQPIIETTRPFCKRLIELDRLYTRAEIEQISARVGFSVWDRKGGFWGHKPECRHQWVRHVVLKKRA